MALAQSSPKLPVIKKIGLTHLHALTDDFGMWQHTNEAEIDLRHGYALDDSARALMVSAVYGDAELTKVYLAFLNHACKDFPEPINFFAGNRLPIMHPVSDDAVGETWWGLSLAMRTNTGEVAQSLLTYLQGYVERKVLSTRGQAYVVLSASSPDDLFVRTYRDRLVGMYKEHATAEWDWPEDFFSYANAILPAALIHAAVLLHDDEAIEIGVRMLRYLNATCTEKDVPITIGNQGWHNKGGKKALFDQQPIDAAYQVIANCIAFKATGDAVFLEEANRFMRWFWGNNLLGIQMINEEEESCYDGLSENGHSLNRGAENIVSYLIAQAVYDDAVKALTKASSETLFTPMHRSAAP